MKEMLKAQNSFVNYKKPTRRTHKIELKTHTKWISRTLRTRALSLLQFTVCCLEYANESLSVLCRPLWLEIRMAQGRVGQSGQRPAVSMAWPGSPHFTYIWYLRLYLVLCPSFPRFSLFFPLCFGLVLGSAKGQHMAQIGLHVLQIRHPKVSQIYHVHTGPSDTVPAGTLSTPTSTPSSVPL